MKNTLIWMHINNVKVDFAHFKKLELDFNYKDYEKLHDLKIITIFDREFPPILTRLENCPTVLFCKGDVSLLSKNQKITVVGKRHANFKYENILEEVIDVLNPEVIVSGLASGWDARAHEIALKRGCKTIAVLPTSFDKIYPVKNIKLFHKIIEYGLVITEYPIGNVLKPGHFLERNRIVCCLSTITICMEPTENSGTSNSLRTSHDIGNEVIVLPSRDYIY